MSVIYKISIFVPRDIFCEEWTSIEQSFESIEDLNKFKQEFMDRILVYKIITEQIEEKI